MVRAGRSPAELAEQFEPSEQCIRNWAKQADRDSGRRQDGLTTAEKEELGRLRRENRALREDRNLREAKLRISQACVEDIDYPASRKLDKQLIRQLATCSWIEEHQNVLVTGPTGVGKTFVACALAQQACRKGYRAFYRRASRLFDELTLARADGTYPRLLAKIARIDVVVTDDWGLVRIEEAQRRDLLEIVEDRHGHRSTILTINQL
jgi:DNA replication protein DnaC